MRRRQLVDGRIEHLEVGGGARHLVRVRGRVRVRVRVQVRVRVRFWVRVWVWVLV